MADLFVPNSIDFVKKHAKQLRDAFPGLSVHISLEATSNALGFENWFGCSKHLEKRHTKTHALHDEELPRDQQLLRRYQQVRAIIDTTTLSSVEADQFVRVWGLTSLTPSRRLSEFRTAFVVMESTLRDRTSDESADEYDVFYEPPEIVADGILAANSGKHRYLIPDVHRLLEIPLYLRGNHSTFLKSEEEEIFAISFPRIFNEEIKRNGIKILQRSEPWLYEWCTGKVSPEFRVPSLNTLIEIAIKNPDDWLPLSFRFSHDKLPTGADSYAVPALRGIEFAQFLRNKGSLRGLDVTWFKVTEFVLRNLMNRWSIHREFHEKDWEDLLLPEQAATKILPLYSSPFKFGPMRKREYGIMVEGGGLMLSQDEPWDD